MNFFSTLRAARAFALLAAISGSLFLASCDDDNVDPDADTDGLIEIAEGYAPGSATLVRLWAEQALFAGYNRLYVELRDSATDELVEEAHVSLFPHMDMAPAMSHAAPYEDPASIMATNGLFPGAVVFQMPGDMGWTLKVMVHNHVNDLEGEVTFPIQVANPALTRTRVLTSLKDGSKFVLSYLLPDKPVVGINDFELTIHRRESMESFPADGTYTIEMEPEMPSMGHGSPNNVNPVHVSDGHYRGEVNFTMTGAWRINLRLMQGGEYADTTTFFDVVLD